VDRVVLNEIPVVAAEVVKIKIVFGAVTDAKQQLGFPADRP